VRLVADAAEVRVGRERMGGGKGGSFIVVEHCSETRCNDFVSFMAKASFDPVDVVAGPPKPHEAHVTVYLRLTNSSQLPQAPQL
jgi:hypothetical protein